MTDLLTEETETTDEELANYQWAWDFARRGDDYNDFYLPCLEVYIASRTKLGPESDPMELLGGGPDFRNSEFYDRLHNEFGLNFPVDPETPGEDICAFIWDFSVCLQGVLVDIKNPDPQYHIKLFADLRLPREYQIEAFDLYLRNKGCAEAVKKRQPDKFAEYLECFDTRKHLRELHGCEPTNFEISCQVWHRSKTSPMTDKDFADKARYPLKMADHYINNKGYFEILRWRPPAKK